jgi:SHS2 domain-containing protein
MEGNRRNRLDLMHQAELSIYNAIQEVEKIGADVRLTQVVIDLGKAKDLLSDFLDDFEKSTQTLEQLFNRFKRNINRKL